MELQELLHNIESAETLDALEKAYEVALGKKWRISKQFAEFRKLSPEEKKTRGAELGELKAQLTQAYELKHSELKMIDINQKLEQELVDITTPYKKTHPGSLSLLSQTRREVEEIVRNMGFHIEYGHDMVTKFENFISLNIPLTHPATEMHDTFFLEDRDETGENYVLRTHTTAMDVNMIKEFGVPCKLIVPAPVYRYENTDASHDTTFYQLEWLLIDKGMSIAHFKNFIQTLLDAVLGTHVEVRMRPGYFPFVEPGYEIDASCPICGWDGCSLCKGTGWIEIVGAGMLHPRVFEYAQVDPKLYTWFAFGLWINRLVAIKYRINDIRLFTNGDLRFSRSFG